jgi:hypothetical protein
MYTGGFHWVYDKKVGALDKGVVFAV